jgi:hypothetical protein
MHAHQWLMEPKDVGSSAAPAGPITDAARPESMTIDSQTFGPGESFTADLLYGSGSKPGTVGDSIFHCHLYPHFAEGFWALFRTHDVLENGSHKTPDGIFVRAIKPLPARTAPPAPDYVVDGIGTDNPGYPRFIPGEFGWRAPQVPYGVTDGGPQGTAAIRLVAGKPLDPAKLAIERGLLERAGRVPKPGAPYVDPCPAGSREVTYNVSVIQTDIVYNEAGWHDTQARILVLDKDVDDVLAGRKPPEPMFIRINAGDCVNYSLTNRLPHWIGNDAFLKLQQTNLIAQHIHLVKFDVLGSDGSTNGWNYQEAAFTKIQKEFNDRARTNTLAAGETCSREEGCRVNDPTDWDPSTRTTANDIGQTIHSRWYADYQLRTVFTHDHHFAAVDQNRGMFGALLVEPKGMDFRNPKTGEYYAPINNAANGTVCGTQCVGTAAGTAMDVIGPGTNDDFREFGLAFQDFVSLTRQGGNPRLASDTLNPPVAPEHFPDDDPGVMGVNYRNAPFKLRETLNGSRVDPAYRLSSTHFGDPKTPLLQAYSNDPIRLRLIQGSQEEQHVFTLHGVRWRDEADDPQSPLSNSRALGISDAINFEVPEIACAVGEACKGDFLYTSASTDDMYLGMWGLMRVYGTPYTGLLGLPDNQPSRTPPLPSATAPCPSSAPVRQLHVVALDAKITYNEQGDHDPYGLMYALVEPGETPDQAVARARAKPEPLAMRGNAGDCLEVRLTNKIDPQGAFARLHAPKGSADGDPNLPLETPSGTPAGLRVSLHPQLLRYDVRSSDGAAVGFNPDQTVAPGASIVYRWFADEVAPGELGTTNLLDYGDIRGHRHHGLFAGLTIEPKGATHHDPFTGAQIRSGVSADIRVPGMQDFREFTLFFQDGLNLRDSSGAIIEDPAGHPPAPDEPPAGLDAEDQGEKGFNYANAPFRHRLGGVEPIAGAPDGQALARVFSSTVHGDPKTPIFRAYAGDPVRMRVLQGADKPRQHTFSQAGHAWKAQPDDPGSTLIGTQGAMTVARALNVHFDAGGAGVYTGDYRYNCNVFFHHQSGGLWGITRVYEAPAASALSTPDQLLEVDNPHQAGYHPLMPLEQAEVSATIFNDSNANGVRDASEGPLANASVTLRASDGTTLATRSTDTLGQAIFRVARGSYNLGVGTPPDWAATGPTSATVDATAENARFSTVLGMVQLADVAIRIFDDKNGNQVLDTGEPALAGWQVNLTGNGVTLADTTSTAGLASFDGLKPGSYSATAVPQAGWSATKPIPVAIAVSENMSLQPPNDVRIGFRTAAAPAPTVTSRTPAINAKGVNKASNVTATFSEAVTGVSASSFVLKRGTTVIAAVVSYDATTRVATLNPNADLAADAVYTVELTGGIKNAAGTALLPVSWNFTTGPVPTVSSRSPASGATGVLVGANVTATFSEAVNGVSGTTFVLKNGTTTIAAVVSYNATTKVATLNPNANLARNTVYTVQLTGGIADLAGNPLAATSWKFTTQP